MATNWTKNNLAQYHTWRFLQKANQIKKEFEQAEGQTMEQLRFWNKAASSNARQILAGAYASAMDDYFRDEAVQATFENGYHWGKAVNAMAAVLTSSKKTVHDLSEIVDAAYDFVGEPAEKEVP